MPMLSNRRVRKWACVLCMAIEPCLHLLAARGIVLMHPEGISDLARTYFQIED
jgi:hypothetical protein